MPGGGGNKKGHVHVAHPEKWQHTQHLNDALADALNKWEPADGADVEIKFLATIDQNPGGISDYWVSLVRQ